MLTSVLVYDRLQVTHDVMVLHTISANQFVDSLEYDRVMSGHGSSETFQVIYPFDYLFLCCD